MDDQRPPVERLLDLALYAPVGVLVALRDDLPKHVRQGRQAVENRVQLARFIGELAVQQGRKELAKRIEASRHAAEADVVASPSTEAEPANPPDVAEPAVAGVVDTVPIDADDAPTADELPIAEYESLAAIHVVERLPGLQPDELEAVRRFETAHRARRTVLAKIAQIQDHQTQDQQIRDQR
jgi:hypothetical protein